MDADECETNEDEHVLPHLEHNLKTRKVTKRVKTILTGKASKLAIEVNNKLIEANFKPEDAEDEKNAQ